ncbi:MAG: HAMP domain-containing protein [Lachnospiraceae bacterium]|nr:HAMP domain-containing protein [Lachnospiraceae bacterium]
MSKNKKRKSLKNILSFQIIIFVAVIITVITVSNVVIQSKKITELTESVIGKESISYSNEIFNWWNGIVSRVNQTASVYRGLRNQQYDDTLKMLLNITENDPDAQDIYMAYGKSGRFLDGSGWIPTEDFDFSGRAWYTGAIAKKGAIYTSDPYVDAATGKTCLACSVMVRDDVVLSCDITFDKVLDKMNNFKSCSSDTKYYIINIENNDILISNIDGFAGTNLNDSTDPYMTGLKSVLSSLDTSHDLLVNKVKTAKTPIGEIMYAATEIQDTPWLIVSAIPRSFITSSLTKNALSILAMGAMMLVVLALLLFFVLSKYLKPVSTVTEKIAVISGGDFTVNISPEGNNEITTLSESLKEYIENMRGMLTHLAGISKNMSENAGECFEISHTLADSNQIQGESIERLNSGLAQMNNSIDDIAGAATNLASISGRLSVSANEVKELCDQTMNSSRDGRAEMQAMTSNVSTLNDTIKELTNLIHATAASVEQISGITDTINAISEQTNLLSLNASIEAARAGEMGRGFAVVASEVGTLAGQSSEATDTIRDLVTSITSNIEDISRKADICVKDMEACLTGVDRANKSFDSIYEDVAKATEGINEIAGDIQIINDVATNNAATTEEQASTIAEILSLSDSIVSESDKLLSETGNVTNISENLNKYSEDIENGLSKYIL